MTADTLRSPIPSRAMSIFYQVHVVASLVESVVAESLKHTELSGSDYAVVSVLSVDDAVTPGEIAQHTGSPFPTISRALARLEQRGLVRRAAHPTDGRSALISLTESGRAQLESARPVFSEAVARVEQAMNGVAGEVGWALDRLEDALRASTADSSPTEPDQPRPSVSITYSGQALTRDQETQVREYIDYVRWRDR